MTILKNFLKVIIEAVYIILGVVLTNYFTVIYWLSEYTITNSPNEQIYPVDLAINILLIKGICLGIYYIFISLQKRNITLNFTDSSGEYTEIESYSFESDVTTIYLNIHIEGRLDKLNKDKIILNLPPGVTASKGKTEDIKYEIIRENKTVEIPLKNIQSSKVYLDEKFYIDFKLIKSREKINSLIEVILVPKFKLSRRFNKNKSYLR